jgi:hypothetical protein
MILFLSPYNGQPEDSYETDIDFTVKGAQTNEAPTKYAIKRLRKEEKYLDKIIALVTATSKESALEHYIDSTKKFCKELGLSEIKIHIVDIPDNVTVTDLLQKTIDAVYPISKNDSVIIETTGGYRNAINALTVFARFLKYSGVNVDFSTYSNYQIAPKKVADTRETDQLFEMLEAVKTFASTGNTKEIKEVLKDVEFSGKNELFTATRNFYYTFLICKTPNIEKCIKDLKNAIYIINDIDELGEEAKAVIFKEMVVKIIEQKMTFIDAEYPVLEFIRWCCANWYLQQAVTFLKESVIKNNKKKYLAQFDYHTLTLLRNSINHATGKASFDSLNLSEKECEEIEKRVQKMLDDPNQIKGFVESIISGLYKSFKK